MKRQMKRVTHDEFHDFINNYPNKLEIDIVHFCEPPLKQYNDFSLGNWPESVVASCLFFRDEPYFTSAIADYVRKGEYLEAKWSIRDYSNDRS